MYFCIISCYLNLQQGGNAGGGSGGSIWINCNQFNGKGFISANGGNVSDEGGGGAGGRITVNYVEGVFYSEQTSAYGGTASGSSVENGGPGIVYLFGQRPLNKNLRIDNRGRTAVVKCSFI